MFRSFFTTIFRRSFAVLCAVTTPPTVLRSLSSYYTVCGRMCMSAGGVVTAQSTAKDPLKMVVKKDRNM